MARNTRLTTGGNRCARIELEPKLDLRASETLAETLRGLRGADLTLDGGRVEHLGAHALQTLLIAVKSWSEDGHSIACENLSAAALEQLAILGVGPGALSAGPRT